MWALYWYSSSFYLSLFSALSLFPCRHFVHPSTKAHIFQFRSINKNLCRKHVYHGTKRPKWLKLSPRKKMDWSGDHLSLLILHNQLQYYLWMDAEIIFRYQFFLIFWDNIRSYYITGGWMLASSVDIKKCFLYSKNPLRWHRQLL